MCFSIIFILVLYCRNSIFIDVVKDCFFLLDVVCDFGLWVWFCYCGVVYYFFLSVLLVS